MSDPVFKIVLQGVDAGASSSVDKMVEKLNKAKETTKRWNDERAKLARQDRTDKFRQLSDEEKLLKLRERQVQIEQRLERATRSGNQVRTSALRLAAARNRASMGGLSQAGGGGIGAAGDFVGAVTGGLGGIGGFVGGSLGATAGVAIAGIGYALNRAVQSTVAFADNIDDAADLMGLTRVQLLKLQRAAGAAGVSSGVPMAALSALASARGSAMAGDENALASFRKFGISKSTLSGDTDNLSLAMAIQRSLGAGGMQSGDRNPLASLLGRRPERALAVLKAMQGMSISDPSGTEADFAKLAATEAKFQDLVNRWKLLMVNVSASLFRASEAVAPYVAKAFPKSIGAFSLVSALNPDSSALPLSPEAQARKDARMRRTASGELISRATSAASGGMGVPQSDSLARIGLYRGGIDPARADILRSQLETLRSINQNTAQTVVKIEGNWK
jgi:hypothetical protein